MIIKSIKGIPGFTAGDLSFLRELLNPAKEPLGVGYSLAHAVVGPCTKTLPHRLKSAEVYYIVQGQGRMHVGDENAEVEAGQAVCIPPSAVQYIENIGEGDLAFLCIVDPAWRAEDEEILEEPAS
jgi:mannose-6-phosphate isomerase-like protein (cupin superfamily)